MISFHNKNEQKPVESPCDPFSMIKKEIDTIKTFKMIITQ